MNMKKKHFIAVAAFLLGASAPMQAQINDDEITVITEDGTEDVIELPEGMLVEIDSLLNLYNTQAYLTDEECNFNEQIPEYPDEVYMERLKRLPTIMEMPYNDVVRKFIDRYTHGLRRSVSYMLGACNFYMPIFEQALEANNLPLELKYLPVIESALHPSVSSPAGASGLWQFMVSSGKQYGLEINSLVDERRDPIKSSYAAAQLLKDLYKIYGDWSTVIAAYNCGPGTINKAMHRAGGSTDYWKIYRYLPKETQGYVPAFIAANYIMNYYCEHNICPMRTELPLKSDTVMVSRDVHFKQVAAVTGISIEQLRTLNPQYRRDLVNGSTKPSSICMPQQYVAMFLDKEDEVYAYDAANLLTKRSQVTVAQTESQPQPTAQRTVSQNTPQPATATATRSTYRRGRGYVQQQPATAYGRKSRSRYGAAQTTTRGRQATTTRKGRGKAAKAAASQSVTVQSGQTLSGIARKHGTTVDKLRKLNGIKGDNIRAGKQIRVK